MKTILKTLLLLAVLCLAGCKEDQSVSFSINVHTTSCIGEILTVNVNANCPWTISENSRNILVEQMSGDGNAALRVNIASNLEYEELSHTITVTSEDGTSSDILVITQEENKGLEADPVGMISEEGGTFTIPVKTNDEIISVDTPDWITFISSRALTSYTCSFSAEPNRTGKVRYGSIMLRGRDISRTVTVEQDSYSPTGIILERDLSFITARESDTGISFEPEYADLSKLELKSSEGCTASIRNGRLHITVKDYGPFSVSFLSDGKELQILEGERVPTEPFRLDGVQEVYLEQSNFLDYWYYSSRYVLRSSDESVVSIDKDGKPHAVGFGTAVVSVSHPEADCHDELTINVEPFLIEARLGWIGEQSDGSFDVRFAARLEGPMRMTCDGFLVMDKDNYVRILNDGSINNGTSIVKTIYTNAINVSRNGYPNINEALNGYQIMAQVSIDGKTYQRTVKINTHETGGY